MGLWFSVRQAGNEGTAFHQVDVKGLIKISGTFLGL
jgi:hypothetical protein